MSTQNKSTQAQMTPQAALQLLREGSDRFREGRAQPRDLLEQVKQTSDGQYPFAAVLGCIDSRAPTELLFDQGIGDIFNVRLAGNCVNADVLGSLEFSCHVAGAKLIVVLGHTRCGAVKGACDKVELGHLTGLLDRIQPAVDATIEPKDPKERTSANASFVDDVVQNNVRLSISEILKQSQILRQMRDEGKVAIVGAIYDVKTGAVTFDEFSSD